MPLRRSAARKGLANYKDIQDQLSRRVGLCRPDKKTGFLPALPAPQVESMQFDFIPQAPDNEADRGNPLAPPRAGGRRPGGKRADHAA